MSIREYSRTHIQEYKGLKPKEVDQSKNKHYAPRTSAITPKKQIRLYENTRENGITINETKKKITHNFHYILTSRIKELHDDLNKSHRENTHTHSRSLR